MEDSLYREVILEHWQNPQNQGVVEGPSFDVSATNPVCGDQIRLTGKMKDGVLEDIRFDAQGCAISIASASLLTERIIGWSLDKLKLLSQNDVLDNFPAKLTPSRTKCALLVHEGLQKVF